MPDLETVDVPKCYEFIWELIGYDCCLGKVQSPKFRVNFLVTEWYLELDFSQLRNTDSVIPLRLQRVANVGPEVVIFDVFITVRLKENQNCRSEKEALARVFSEKGANHWTSDVSFESQRLESGNVLNWLAAKTMKFNVKFKSSDMTPRVFPKKYWYSSASLREVATSMKMLYSNGYFHDLVLKVSEKELKLHKGILNVRWPKLLPTLGVKETSSQVETKELSAIKPAILGYLLEFAYCGDLNFMYQLHSIDGGMEVFSLVNKHNFYRLNDQISHLSPKCESSQMLQSYRTSVEMTFTNVKSNEPLAGAFRTCEIPLKPRHIPRSTDTYKTPEAKEKAERHIRFMDIRLYVDKYKTCVNYLMFSITLGKLPEKNPVVIKCKLFVIKENDEKLLLTEQHLLFTQDIGFDFTTPFRNEKICRRYTKTSAPVIQWTELTNEESGYMRSKEPTDRPGRNEVQKDLYFRFELKLSDGEYLSDMRHGECEVSFEGDYNFFKDLDLLSNDEKFTDITLISDKVAIRAHRAILAARSPKFKSILQSNQSLESLEIDINPGDLHPFVHYLYTGQLKETPVKQIEGLLSVADEYELKCLKKLLLDHQNEIKRQESLFPDTDIIRKKIEKRSDDLLSVFDQTL